MNILFDPQLRTFKNILKYAICVSTNKAQIIVPPNRKWREDNFGNLELVKK